MSLPDLSGVFAQASGSSQENHIDSDKLAAICECHNQNYTDEERKNGDVISEDVSKMYNKDTVNQETMTDMVNNAMPKCKLCSRRMSVLRKIEKVKSKGSNLRQNLKYRIIKQKSRNRGCQTPASFFESAEMTYQEVRRLAIILSLQNEKLLQIETFCRCVAKGWERDCRCGEEDKYFDWVWDAVQCGEAARLKEDGSLAVFHENYSCGTTAVRGFKAMDMDQYFWEIKMTTSVYGTDMMIGVGTKNVELNKFNNTFCSMLGCDSDSWGISYDGRVQHNGKKWKYCKRFGQGTIIGIHLDMWHGTLTFFKNRQCLGVAFKGLRGRTLYPMASSTAARSGMRVISSRSFPSSLQFLCCKKLRQLIPPHLSVLDTVPMPPGLRLFLANNMAWLLHGSCSPKPSLDHVCNICLPLRKALDGHSDNPDNIDDEEMDDIISFRDSDDDDDDDDANEEDLDDFSDRSLQRHSLYLLAASFRRRSRPDVSSPSTSYLPLTHFRASSSAHRSEPERLNIGHSQPSSAKKARLDGYDILNEVDSSEDEEKNSESDSSETNLTDSSSSATQPCKLGKRKHT